LTSKSVRIGLDIGSSAVRAAEVLMDGDRRVLRRFAQVGLPEGAVVEGEIRDREAVTAAIKRLWQHGRFSGRTVVVGVGSQRAMVRQVEMPPMPDSELRSALPLKIGELLPIPVQQAVVDFAPLPKGDGDAGPRRVLVVAAQRDVVTDELAAVEAAGLRVEAFEASSLALLRAVASGRADGGPNELEAVVGIGAELLTIVVRDGGVPRFVRTATLTGPAGTTSGDSGPTGLGHAGRGRSTSAVVVSAAQRLDTIVSEVRSSLEYLVSQSATKQLSQVVITGGGAMVAGVPDALSAAVGVPVSVAEARIELDAKELGLDEEALNEASFRWLTAVGLAQWGTDVYGRTSLVPPEVFTKRKQRRAAVSAVVAIVVVVAGLGAVSYGRVRSADNVSKQIATAQQESASFQRKINALGYVLAIPTELRARRALAAEALSGDIDWIGMMDRLARAMPANVTPTTVTLSKSAAGTTSVTPDAIVGSLNMTAETTGGAKAVAAFIDSMSRVKGLFAVWVSSTTNAKGVTTITATAQLTTDALSARAAALPGGNL
jgi:type IV pilus assembly protein PilM